MDHKYKKKKNNQVDTYKMLSGSQQTPKIMVMATNSVLVFRNCSWRACCLRLSFTVVEMTVSR